MITTINSEKAQERETVDIVKVQMAYPCTREEDEGKYLNYQLTRQYIYSPDRFDEIKKLHVEQLERQIERQKAFDAKYRDEDDEEDVSHVPALTAHIAEIKRANTLEEMLSTVPKFESLKKTHLYQGVSISKAIK